MLATSNIFSNQNSRDLYDQSLSRGIRGKLLELFGSRHKMTMLAERMAGHAVRGQHSAGIQTVEVNQITGSESRVDDFDRNFNPCSDHSCYRWVTIAEMRLNDCPLPPVELIQVGNEYFVRDGHHRISVARAIGAAYIDAEVTVLEV